MTTTRPTTIIRIPRSLVALRDVCASKSVRYALDCVHVERRAGVARATATDGKMLIRASWDDAGPDVADVLVPSDEWKTSRSTTSRRELALHVTAGSLALDGRGLPDVEKTYPPVEDVLPRATREESRVTLDAVQLFAVGRALFAHGEALAALGVYASGGGDFVALDFTGPDALCTGVAVRGSFHGESKKRERLYFPALNPHAKHADLESPPKSVGLNPRLLHRLADAMARAAGTRDGDDAPLPVMLGIADAHSSMRVTLANPGTGPVRLEAVLMPITLESGS